MLVGFQEDGIASWQLSSAGVRVSGVGVRRTSTPRITGSLVDNPSRVEDMDIRRSRPVAIPALAGVLDMDACLRRRTQI